MAEAMYPSRFRRDDHEPHLLLHWSNPFLSRALCRPLPPHLYVMKADHALSSVRIWHSYQIFDLPTTIDFMSRSIALLSLRRPQPIHQLCHRRAIPVELVPVIRHRKWADSSDISTTACFAPELC